MTWLHLATCNYAVHACTCRGISSLREICFDCATATLNLLSCQTNVQLHFVTLLRDPYSFFIKVVSWASKPDDTLARANFGLPKKIAKLCRFSGQFMRQSQGLCSRLCSFLKLNLGWIFHF